MKTDRLLQASPLILAFVLCSGAAQAEKHIREVLLDANEAVQAVGDSIAIREHASDALEVIDDAKFANASRSDVVEYLDRGEGELQAAVTNAARFNTETAWQDAVEAKRYLEAADHAADGEPPR